MSRERTGLEFFSVLAASVTHELNNALSVIDQADGLLGDFAAAMEAGRAIDPERLRAARERINRQVRKGVEIVSRFNRFAHSTDDPEARFDISGETENLMALARRFADLKRVGLECSLPEKEILVSGDAFRLQQAVFTALEMILDGCEEGDRVKVSVAEDDGAAVIKVEGSGRAVEESDPRFERLASLAAELGGAVRMSEGEPGGAALELRARM